MRIYFAVLFSLLTVLLLGACGGGGGGSSTPSIITPIVATQTVTGVAATGTPISGTVYLKDSSSPAKEISTTINADGSFSFDVSNLTAPFILKAVGTANGQSYTLYSFAGAPGVANINPLTHLEIVQANGGIDPATLYAAPTAAQLQSIKTALSTILSQIQSLLQPLLSQYGVSTSTNFITDTYTANHSGLDLLFDMVAIGVKNGSLTITNKSNGTPILNTTLNGSTLSGQITSSNIPTITIQTVGTVFSYPQSITVNANSSVTFNSIVIGSTNQSVVWSVVESNGGSITSTGVYTAPATAGIYHVKATSKADSTKYSTSVVTVTAASTSTASQIWVTDSTVSPSVKITIGPSLGVSSYVTYYSGTISSSVLSGGSVTVSQISTSSYITTMVDGSMLIGAANGNYWILIGTNSISSTTTSVSAFIDIFNGVTKIYGGTATLVKQ